MKHRLIVRFVHRDKREEMYKKRRNLIKKNINNLPSVQAAMGVAARSNNKIRINESLTGYQLALSMTSRERTIINTYGLQVERSC